MNTKPREIPRFLPTLTEVVDPSELVLLQAAPEKQDVARLVELVRQQVWPAFERKLQEEWEHLVRLTLNEQWPVLNLRLHQEMDVIVEQVVRDAMSNSETKKTQ